MDLIYSKRGRQDIMAKGLLKRKSQYYEDEIELSLSNIEQNFQSVEVFYTVEKILKDKQWIHHEKHRTTVHVPPPQAPQPPIDMPVDDFFADLGAIDINTVQTEKKKLRRDDTSRRQRYVSSVRFSCLVGTLQALNVIYA